MATTLTFTAHNATEMNASLFWCDDKGNETWYAMLPPGSSKAQETFGGHKWVLRVQNEGLAVELVAAAGPPQRMVLTGPDGAHENLHPESSFYEQSLSIGAAGMVAKASAEVSAGAVVAAADIAREMLAHCPSSVTDRLAAQKCAIAIIGKAQVTSDIPEHRAWALRAVRPSEAGVEAVIQAAPAEPDVSVAQRVAMAQALRPRLESLDKLSLVHLVCGLVEQGSCSDVAVIHGLVASAANGPDTELSSKADPDAAFMDHEPSSAEAVVASDPMSSPAPPPPPPPPPVAQATETPKSIDETTRGVGGGPVCSVGEENLLDVEADPRFREESVLVHEFGHTVMNLGVSEEARGLIRRAYEHAAARGLYPPAPGTSGPCYMASNADEYWAEGTQAWFDATIRRDVNSGVNNRTRLQAHDPALALLLSSTYGDGPWRFTDTVRTDTRERWLHRQIGDAC